MFDLSQLVFIEVITLIFAVLFLFLGFKFNNKALGLIAALECLLTTFMSRHELMSYWAYDGTKSDIAFIFYNAGIVIIQTAVISIISIFYKSPWLILTYSFNVLIVAISFFIAQAVILSPDSSALLNAQSLIDDKIYWYVYSVSMLFICIGIMGNGSKGGRGINIVRIFGDNMLNNRVLRSQLARVVARIKRRVQGS
tara:strand:+ start:162 stop:752 length:591 start_codon:yes stop_codon:yes gene_type:complete